ncbi:DUF3899 domain-containing protein [Enterococcus faecalis]
MKKRKWPLLTAFISTIGIFLYLLLGKKELSIVTLSDTFFLVALFFLIIGIALWIMSSGFFDNFQRFMKQSLRFKRKNDPKEFVPLSTIGKDHSRFWLETGGILLIPSLVFLIFYFL